MVDELQVGVITGTHGIRGDVKVFPITDDPSRLSELDSLIMVCPDGSRRVMKIKKARMHKGQVLILFEDYENINLVECFKGAELYVERKDAAPLSEDEYYYADLIGMQVFRLRDDSEEKMGELVDVMETGPNEVFVIRTSEGREILIPAIHDCVKEVDIEEGIMKVSLLPGMEDL